MGMREPTNAEAYERIEAAKAMLDAYGTMALSGCSSDSPWVTRVYFIEDEPRAGSFDMCCSVLLSDQRRKDLAADPRVAFIVAGDDPDRWLTGVGRAEVIDDPAESAALRKRLADKTPAAKVFLERTESTAVRVHVERLKATDLDAEPPVAEFTFA